MKNLFKDAHIELFSTCPQSSDTNKDAYIDRVLSVARWSERCGCKGILVYTDNSLVDPWLVSQLILQNTQQLCPLVAIQPVYMHPYAVAKMIASFGHFYDRRIYLNMVAGGFKNDLVALNDLTPHDKRYDRLVEYTLIIKQLLDGENSVTFKGSFYEINNLKLKPSLPKELFPGIFISGSSDAGLAAAKTIGATTVKYPKPPGEEQVTSDGGEFRAGIRVGIIARKESKQAWDVARNRFPEDRRGQLAHQLAMKTSDSLWHKQLSAVIADNEPEAEPYWLVPFQNYKTFCPYLVGSYECVAEEVLEYMSRGFKSFILDIPPMEEELDHTSKVFEMAIGRS